MLLGGVEDWRKRLVERDPGVTVTRLAMIGRRRVACDLLLASAIAGLRRPCRCDHRSSHDSRRRAFHRCTSLWTAWSTMAAAILQRRGLSIAAQETARCPRRAGETASAAGESSSGTTAYQNRRKTFCFVVSMIVLRIRFLPQHDRQVSRSTALSCHEPSASFDSRDHRQEQRDAGERDQKQRREHARDVELIAGLQDLIGEPGIAARRCRRRIPPPPRRSAQARSISAGRRRNNGSALGMRR